MAFCVSHPRLCSILESIKMARSQSRSLMLTISRGGFCARNHLPSLRRRAGVFDGVKNDQEVEFVGKKAVEEEMVSSEPGGGGGGGGGGGDRVTVVVDSSVETKWALEWALSHTVQDFKWKIRLFFFLWTSPKKAMRVKVVMVEGKEKGPVIVEASKQQKASLLVRGQRKTCRILQLLKRWAWKGGHGSNCSSSEVDYCIQNASCMAIAVRRMSNELGGYLITTKRHKNFWLLA